MTGVSQRRARALLLVWFALCIPALVSFHATGAPAWVAVLFAATPPLLMLPDAFPPPAAPQPGRTPPMSTPTDADSRSHLTGHPKDATDVDLVNAMCGLTSRIARVPSDPNGSQANDLHQMRGDLDRVRAEVLRRLGTGAPATSTTENACAEIKSRGPATIAALPHTTRP